MAKAKPVALLVRRARPEPHWELYGRFDSESAAETAHRKFIAGRGVTAWSWWGPMQTAALMLADPHYDPGERRADRDFGGRRIVTKDDILRMASGAEEAGYAPMTSHVLGFIAGLEAASKAHAFSCEASDDMDSLIAAAREALEEL